MSYYHYERLSALDSMFLAIEESNAQMHVGAVVLFDAEPLTGSGGEFDIDSIRTAIEGSLTQSPRFRQKLAWVPLFDHPVWVDDDRFNLNYHIRHTSLPRPGDIRLLKRLVGRIMSQTLDRGKPLWEMWVVEGIEEGRFSVIFKAHHCMVDGIAGFDLLTRIIRPDPEAIIEPPRAWFPKPAPSSTRLLLDELLLRATWPVEALRVAGRLVGEPQEVIASAQEALVGMREVLGAGLAPTSPTPLNADTGPHRRFDWARFDMSAVKEVRKGLGGTVNDVVLATAAGAIGRFLRRRGVRQNDTRFRAQVPVSIRTQGEHDTEGNRLVMLLAELPIHEPDPRTRLGLVIETTQRLKQSRQRAGVEFFEEISDRTLTSLFVYFARLATWQRSFNIVITNIPGPPIPGYLLGARMLEVYPLVPLAKNQALGIALFSYAGSLYWGFNSDWDALPDLHDFVDDLGEEFERMRQSAHDSSSSRPAEDSRRSESHQSVGMTG